MITFEIKAAPDPRRTIVIDTEVVFKCNSCHGIVDVNDKNLSAEIQCPGCGKGYRKSWR